MRVEVDVENPKLELVPGMYATASLVLDRARGVLVAPIEAVDRSETGSRVLVVNQDSRIEPRRVTLGLESADRVEIRNGVSAADLVVVGNRAQLKAGTPVVPRVIDPAPADTDRR
jgi:multidrug efflux pump subunit AcrA (membrane-fusion protein)